jgi:hypothetical protein
MRTITILEGELGFTIGEYVNEFRDGGTGFEDFSNEAILYALLEYSKKNRSFTKIQRIIFIYQRCKMYTRQSIPQIEVKIDPATDLFSISIPSPF